MFDHIKYILLGGTVREERDGDAFTNILNYTNFFFIRGQSVSPIK